jgi:RNA polymerase sigma factor (sigma-70 family)
MKRRRLQGEPLDAPVVDSAVSPEVRVLQGQRRERLGRAIRALPVSQRQVLSLALEDLDHRSIGEILGIRENAVSVRLHRARKRLTALLEES